MDAWAASYGSSVAFVCVCCAGPQLASQFGTELRLKNCYNTWVDHDDMPSWGQLGCNGFIVVDGSDAVVCKASSAFLEVRQNAFRHVEQLLDALLSAKPAPKLSSGRVDESVGGACAKVRFGDGEDDEEEQEEEQQVILSGLVSRPELNGKRGRVLSQAADGRLEVQVEGEAAPLSIKRQNLTPVAEPEAGPHPVSVDVQALKVPSVKVDVLDAEHERCEAKLGLLGRLTESGDVGSKRLQIADALQGLLAAYEEHFAHEEALLDEHLYAGLAQEAVGFSADKGARTSHFADHQTMLTAVRRLLAEEASVSYAEIAALAADFERHATAYDGSYADRLSEAMAKPVAVA